MASGVWSRWRGLARAPWWPAVPLLLLQLANGFYYLPQVSFFPIYLADGLRYPPVAIAALMAAGQAAGLVAGFVGGALCDRYGSKHVIVLGLAAVALCGLVYQARTPWLVAGLWFLGGLALGFQGIGGSSYLTQVVDPRSLGLLSALYALSNTMGGALGNPVAGVILDGYGFRVFGLAALALSSVTLLAALVGLPGLPPARAGVGLLWRVAPGEGGSFLGRPAVLLLLGLRFLPTVYYGLSLFAIPLLINQAAGSKTTVAVYVTASLVAASLAQLAAGRAADRFGGRGPALVSFGALILAALGLGLFCRRLWGIFVFGMLGNGAAWALSSLLFVLVSYGVPRPEHGRAFGLLHATWSTAMITGSLLGGALFRAMPGLPFLAAAVLNLGSLALVLTFYRRISDVRLAPAPHFSQGD